VGYNSNIKLNGVYMARKGTLGKIVTKEWAKHLRKIGKKMANKVERKNAKLNNYKLDL